MFLFAKLMSIKRKMQLCIFGCAEAEKFPRSLWFAGHLRITTLLACLVGTQLLRRRENKWLLTILICLFAQGCYLISASKC